MNFDANRLARLAGLPVSESRTLTEASNRSYHDEDANDDSGFRHGNMNQLAEKAEMDDVDEAHCGGQNEADMGQSDDPMPEVDEMSHSMKREQRSSPGLSESSDEYVNIDEEMLAEEIRKMRQETLEENQLRSVIRAEIASIVKGIKDTPDAESRNTSFDGITKGFPGPGFR